MAAESPRAGGEAGGPEGEPAGGGPPGGGGRLPLFERLDRFLRRKPVRYLALEYDFHLLPYRVSHSRRARRAIAVAVVALIAFSAWYWVVPRMDARLSVQYHEGLFNAIDVDARVINSGTVALSSLTVELVVTVDGTGEAIGSSNASRSLPAHATLEMDPVAFRGDQLTTDYRISVNVRFVGKDGAVVRTFGYVTVEPVMNQYFEDVLA